MRKARKVDPEIEKHWRDVFKRFQKSGMPFKKFCAGENISHNTFQYWRKELRIRDEKRGIVSAISKGDNRKSELPEKIKYWAAVLADLKVYPGSQSAFCRERRISSGNLHYWSTRLAGMTATDDTTHTIANGSDFVRFVLTETENADASDSIRNDAPNLTPSNQIQIALRDGTIISVAASAQVEAVVALVNGLRSMRC